MERRLGTLAELIVPWKTPTRDGQPICRVASPGHARFAPQGTELQRSYIPTGWLVSGSYGTLFAVSGCTTRLPVG